jgi:16S rRNA (adenine1518-N6/adenine1519-N6)-dimethyltransferase
MSLKQKTLERMQEFGIAPKRSLGQNFLVSEMVVEKIMTFVERAKPEEIIEVGPGLGALTDRLKAIAPLKLVELDRKFVEYWRTQGFDVFEVDALKAEWSDLLKGKEKVVVGNLPYQISSRLVIDLSFVTPPPKAMIFMFQKEVAEKLTARPSTEAYGLLSVIAQSYWDISLVTNAGMQDFYPAPNVGSRVMIFKPLKSVPERNARFLGFVKAAFAQRRKFLIKNLQTYSNDWQSTFQKLGLKPDIRAEALSKEQFWSLFETVK